MVTCRYSTKSAFSSFPDWRHLYTIMLAIFLHCQLLSYALIPGGELTWSLCGFDWLVYLVAFSPQRVDFECVSLGFTSRISLIEKWKVRRKDVSFNQRSNYGQDWDQLTRGFLFFNNKMLTGFTGIHNPILRSRTYLAVGIDNSRQKSVLYFCHLWNALTSESKSTTIKQNTLARIE